MSQTVQFVDFKQLVAQDGDTSSLSEAELGRLKKQYEKLRKEWARKRRKLEKLDRAARAKQHVRKKLQEQQCQTGGATDTSSPIQQQGCGRGDPPLIRGQLVPGGCPRDGDSGEETTREGEDVHNQQEDHTAVVFTCGKSVSFSLDITSADENTQHEHPAKFKSCTVSTVPSSEENPLKSTDELKICDVAKAENVTKQSTRQDSSKSNSYSFATFPHSIENSTQNAHSTSDKCDSNDPTVQEEDVSIVQESSATLGLGNASACIQEELSENEYDRNVSENEELTIKVHFGDAVQGNIQDTRNRKPLFKGSFRQTITNENLDEAARLSEQKISIQTQGEDLNTIKEKSPRKSSTCSALDLSVEYVDDNLSECRVPESSHCEGQIPGQHNQLPLANTTILLDSEEDETECIDELHHSHVILTKNQTKQKENTGIMSAEQKVKPSSLDTQSQRNVTELSPHQELLEEGKYDNKNFAKNSVELSSDVHEEDNSQMVKPSQGNSSKNTSARNDNKKVAKNFVELCSGQEDFHEEDNSQIVEPSQGNFNKNTWVDGLMFPAEYYVRTTRRMQRQGLTPEGVARQVKARTTQRKQKRKVDSNDDGALEDKGGKKQAKLDSPGEKSTDGELNGTVIPDTQYGPSKSCFLFQDSQKSLNNLPLVCEGIVQEKLQVLRKGRKASSTHNTPLQTSGLRRLVKGRKKTRSCQNSPVQTGCSSVLKEGEESVQDCSQVVEVQRLVKGRKTTRSCQNSPAQSTGCSSVLKGGEESLQDCSQVVETRSCQNSRSPIQSGCLNILEGGEESVQDCSQVVEVQRFVKGRKTTRSCQNSPVQTGCLNVLKGGEESVQDCSLVVEGDVLCRRSKRLKNRYSQEVQNSTSQEQKALEEVQALTAQPESEFLDADQDSKKETQRFFPVLSDQLRGKLSNSAVTEFHLPYSDYGTLKVAKAREAPSAGVGKKCSSRSSNGMDAKDERMPSKDSSVNCKKEDQATLLGAESLLPSRCNKNLDATFSLSSCKGNSPKLPSKTKDARMPYKEAAVNNKKKDQPKPISAEGLSPLRSNRNLNVSVSLSSCEGNSPNLASKTELGQERSRNLFPSLSPMLHKKCTEAVLDFSLVGTEYVKLKLNKVKSSPQLAATTSSCVRNSRHGKGRHPMSKAKENLQASSRNSENLAKENNSSVKQPSDVTDVQNSQQQKVHEVVQEKSSKVRKEDSLLRNNNQNEFSRTTSPDTSVQPSLGSEVRVCDSGMQAPSKSEEVGKSAMSCSHAEDQNAGVDRNKVETMCENRKQPVTASTKPLEPQSLVVSNCKSPWSKAIEMTSLENNEMRICESQALQETGTVVVEGTHREIACPDCTELTSQKMEDTDTKHCVKITSECFNGRMSESESFLRSTSVEDGDERDAGTVVEETGEEGVATRVPDLSTCLKPTATREVSVVSVALCEARIHEEDAAVLAVCRNTTVSLWVWQGEDWAQRASWEIPEHVEVCDVFLLPCEVGSGVQVMVGGNFTTGFIKFFHYDGVSTSSQEHSWDEGVALVGDGFHGDGCHGDSYHAMAVLPQGVAIATGPCDGGSSVCKLTMSSPAGHVQQQTRLPVPAGQRIGSLQQVEWCAGCLMGTGDNQVLLWNHTAGVLLRCFDLPGAHPTCLYAVSAQGLLFAVVCSPAEEHQDRCHLVAINPRTGRSLTLQKYQLPHGSSLARCTNGVMDGSRLLVIQDSKGLYLWDFFSGEMEPVLPGIRKKSSCGTTGK